MPKSYYPWNLQELVVWLKEEQSRCQGFQALASTLGIPQQTLLAWLRGTNTDITLEQLCAIARYRGWSTQVTVQWLEIKPAHWQTLLENDTAFGSAASLSYAYGL